ncbi:hypothetical protein HB662_05515 [Roseomonas frigidaquae]|uniref:Uncharacterized protein n=1 Tax=Falsiroseomonas frigidaquae TaxID=487318 RepID=A0ABX1EWD4_9PROT|nr:hypothetical protein [Falsiroseomonas frigidaquae]NKE44225.1 hypothetical protein [Falsiroseomonas frigidaquae]
MQDTIKGFAASLPERQASFAERGCAMPFTAPMLSGARLRRGSSGPAEMLLPALGGRGVYVMGWNACLLHCAPSLHDRQLWDRIATQERPTPALVRAAAREVARLGYAGRPAQAAAKAALRQQEAVRDGLRDVLAARFLPLAPDAADLLAPMVAVLAQAGTGPGQLSERSPSAAIPQAIVALEAFCASIAAWSQMAQTPQERRGAAIALGAARMTLLVADASLQALWRTVAELPARLARGEVRQGDVLPLLADLASRADWLLDGWTMVGALWAAAGAAGRGGVLAELVSVLPVPPLEAESWPGPRAEWDTLLRARRMVAPGPAWSCGGLVDLAQRNEALRALAP